MCWIFSCFLTHYLLIFTIFRFMCQANWLCALRIIPWELLTGFLITFVHANIQEEFKAWWQCIIFFYSLVFFFSSLAFRTDYTAIYSTVKRMKLRTSSVESANRKKTTIESKRAFITLILIPIGFTCPKIKHIVDNFKLWWLTQAHDTKEALQLKFTSTMIYVIAVGYAWKKESLGKMQEQFWI